MREIKFKVWDKDRKKFAKQIITYKLDRDNNICLVVYLDKVNKTREIFDIDKNFCNNFEILQDTCLKDYNSVEIYEGDIVKLYDAYGEFLSLEKVIQYPCGLWYLDTNENDAIFDIINYSDKTIEVIGNIYENPELLECNKDAKCSK